MPTHFKIELNPDEQTIVFNGRKMGLKTSGLANNGLSLDPSTHKLVATKAPDGRPGSGGTMNLPGNGIGPTNASMSTRLSVVGFNSSVSRKKKAPAGSKQYSIDNDGPVMCRLSGGNLVANGSVAYYMIQHGG